MGAILVSWGAIIGKGAKGRGAILKLILDILELQMKTKKKLLGKKLSCLREQKPILFFIGGNLKKKGYENSALNSE